MVKMKSDLLNDLPVANMSTLFLAFFAVPALKMETPNKCYKQYQIDVISLKIAKLFTEPR